MKSGYQVITGRDKKGKCWETQNNLFSRHESCTLKIQKKKPGKITDNSTLIKQV